MLGEFDIVYILTYRMFILSTSVAYQVLVDIFSGIETPYPRSPAGFSLVERR